MFGIACTLVVFVQPLTNMSLLFLLLVLGGLSITKEQNLRNEYLITVGSNTNGSAVVTLSSRTGNLSRTLDDKFVLSPACGPYPSLCRELAVDSFFNNTKHIVFVPLENGVGLLEYLYLYNDSYLELQNTHAIEYPLVNNNDCNSLGVFEALVADSIIVYYSLCFQNSMLFQCQLQLNQSYIEQSRFRNCGGIVNLQNRPTQEILRMMSNIVKLDDDVLFFSLANRLYWFFLSDSRGGDSIIEDCPNVMRLVPQSESNRLTIYIYCNNSMVSIFNVESSEFGEQIGPMIQPFPCGLSKKFQVNTAENNVSYISGDNTQVFSLPLPTQQFYTGSCIEYNNIPLFVFVDREEGVILLNSFTMNFTTLSAFGCLNCEPLLVYGDQYLVIRNHQDQIVSVTDLESVDFPIISVQQQTTRLVLLLSLPSKMEITTGTTPTPSTNTESPTSANQPTNITPIVAGVIVPIVLLVVLIPLCIGIPLYIHKRHRSDERDLDVTFEPVQPSKNMPGSTVVGVGAERYLPTVGPKDIIEIEEHNQVYLEELRKGVHGNGP